MTRSSYGSAAVVKVFTTATVRDHPRLGQEPRKYFLAYREERNLIPIVVASQGPRLGTAHANLTLSPAPSFSAQNRVSGAQLARVWPEIALRKYPADPS